jgi:hypothetical protein
MGIRAETEKLTANFAKAVTNKDCDGLGSFYERHSCLSAAGAPMVEGRGASGLRS